jgi:small GTP-binding protein
MCAKVVIVGDSGVGKTSLLQAIVYRDVPDPRFTPTIGLDLTTYVVPRELCDNRALKINFWDTAGQERYAAIIPTYLRASAAVLLVFAVDNRNSFTNLAMWLARVRDAIESPSVILVAAKADLAACVHASEREEYAAAEGLAACVETSAVRGTGLAALVAELARVLLGRAGPFAAESSLLKREQRGSCCRD